MNRIYRALLSVSDKRGLAAFARGLAERRIELVATRGTADELARAGLPVQRIEEQLGIPELLAGRVKTLHPAIHAGILARRTDANQMRELQQHRYPPIDMVVVNLYPFEATAARPGVTLAEALEQIDIGGATLLRAAAKNFEAVAVVSHPDQYARVLTELAANLNALPDATLRWLAGEAIRRTVAYDQAITAYLGAGSGAAPPAAAETIAQLTIGLESVQPLRYGENPHQTGGFYRESGRAPWGLGALRQVGGKELSYNNLLDCDAAWRLIGELREPACAILKHASPCGVAQASSLAEAFRRALACDSLSAYGGIVGCNRPVDRAAAEAIAAADFLEVVLAPDISPEAMGLLVARKSLRLVTVPDFTWPQPPPRELRSVAGGLLVQTPDAQPDDDPSTWTVVSKRPPTEAERQDLRFAWVVAKATRSNAIVLVKDGATVGLGMGLPSRVGSVRWAVSQAGAQARGAVLASDAFFPKADGVEMAVQAGVAAIVQPGGSKRDADVIAAADAAGMAMLVTGRRHFRH